MDMINIFRLGIYSTKFYCFCCFNHHNNILSRYFGHGTGREFLQGDDIQRLDCRAVTLLMGCSSGKLQVSIFQTVEENISIYNWCRQTNKGKGSVQLFGSFVKYAC